MKSDLKRQRGDISETVSATEFKVRCRHFLDRVGNREVGRVVITKRGKVVAVLTPPDARTEILKPIWGFMRDSVIVPDGVDLTDPICDEPFEADRGEV